MRRRRFRHLYHNRADIRMPGLTVMTLSAHRHLSELASVEPHSHRWCQAILYLGGKGTQTLAGRPYPVGMGSLVIVPPGVPHSFARSSARVPESLLIDFRLPKAALLPATACALESPVLADTRRDLARLLLWRGRPNRRPILESSTLSLQIVARLLRAAGWLPEPAPRRARKKPNALTALLAGLRPDTSLSAVIHRSGYQRDHLNRLVRAETGLTLGQYRAQERLALAKRLLSGGLRICEVAAEVGLPDQGYFARWFRMQTGLTPTAWRTGSSRSPGAAASTRGP